MIKKQKRLKAGDKIIDCLLVPLGKKNLVLLRGSKGYVMCGYLDLKVADKFKDVAVKITGVSSIGDAIDARVHSCSSAARKLGIYKNQPIKKVLEIIA